jgi:hypothetical protein
MTGRALERRREPCSVNWSTQDRRCADDGPHAGGRPPHDRQGAARERPRQPRAGLNGVRPRPGARRSQQWNPRRPERSNRVVEVEAGPARCERRNKQMTRGRTHGVRQSDARPDSPARRCARTFALRSLARIIGTSRSSPMLTRVGSEASATSYDRRGDLLHVRGAPSAYLQDECCIRTPNRMSYAAVGGPNQVVSASWSPRWVRSPAQATYPSGRINTAVGAVTAPSTGSSQIPTYLASIN